QFLSVRQPGPVDVITIGAETACAGGEHQQPPYLQADLSRDPATRSTLPFCLANYSATALKLNTTWQRRYPTRTRCRHGCFGLLLGRSSSRHQDLEAKLHPAAGEEVGCQSRCSAYGRVFIRR
ncbi:hypothetical protein Vretifemale_3226, partial [Volvox reticuliferus]